MYAKRKKENANKNCVYKRPKRERRKAMDKKAMYLCNGEKEDCRKKSANGELVCYRHSDGNEIAVCHHTSDIRYARNFEQIYSGFFYEKEDVPGNETPSAD